MKFSVVLFALVAFFVALSSASVLKQKVSSAPVVTLAEEKMHGLLLTVVNYDQSKNICNELGRMPAYVRSLRDFIDKEKLTSTMHVKRSICGTKKYFDDIGFHEFDFDTISDLITKSSTALLHEVFITIDKPEDRQKVFNLAAAAMTNPAVYPISQEYIPNRHTSDGIGFVEVKLDSVDANCKSNSCSSDCFRCANNESCVSNRDCHSYFCKEGRCSEYNGVVNVYTVTATALLVLLGIVM